LIAPSSDHNPILLDTHKENLKLTRPFLFEAMWTRKESSAQVIEKAWQLSVEASQSFILARKLEQVGHDLRVWNRNSFSFTRTQIKELEKTIEEIQGKEPTQANLEHEAALYLELDVWLQSDELKWRQKFRELWLKEGDRNSRFFHLSTIIRQRRNTITEIKMEDRSWLNSREAIGRYFTDKFTELY
jgi:hypothetical protein